MNGVFDKFQITENGITTWAGLNLLSSIGSSVYLLIYWSLNKKYAELERLGEKGEIIYIDKLDKDQLEKLKNSCTDNEKCVILSGLTLSASTFKENNFDLKSSISSIPPKGRVIDYQIERKSPYPKEVLAIYDDFDKITGQNKKIVWSQFYLASSNPCLISLGYQTTFGGLKYQTDKDESYFSQLYKTFPKYVNLEMNTFKSLRHIVVEGEMITVAGLVKYNSNLKEFHMSEVYWMISGTWSKVINKLIKNWRNNYKAYIMACVITFSLYLFGTYCSSKRKQYLDSLANVGNLENNK